MIDFDNLDPETLYVILDGDRTLYARTPDGIGCYWYDEDQRDEAEGDVCTPVHTRHFFSFDEWDEYRFRETK